MYNFSSEPQIILHNKVRFFAVLSEHGEHQLAVTLLIYHYTSVVVN